MIVTPECIFGGSGISAELFASLRRSDYIITILSNRVWRVVSEDSRTDASFESFLLIARTARIVTARCCLASSGGFSGVPAFSQIL